MNLCVFANVDVHMEHLCCLSRVYSTCFLSVNLGFQFLMFSVKILVIAHGSEVSLRWVYRRQ